VDELEDLPGEKPSRISTFGVEFLYLLNRTLQIGLASEPEPAIRSRDSAGRAQRPAGCEKTRCAVIVTTPYDLGRSSRIGGD
jgi:hypothetical protein